MSVTARETETKYEMPEGAVLPSLDELPQVNGTSGPDEQQLEAEYYDTDDLRLLRAGITLRRRRGGSDAGWHLKLPEGPGTRREIRLPLGQRRPVPRELAQLVRVYTRGAPLRPVARLTTRRQTLVLLGEGGESLAEVASDDVSAQTMGDSTTVSQWRELEVELTGGDRRLLKAADALLRRDGLRPAGRSAKLERALAGRGRRDEPDSVHQMRVATRRLRSTLRSFKRVIGRGDHLAAELKWLGGVLGEARDAEVLEGHLQAILRTVPVEQLIGPVQARLQIHFAPVLADARTAVLAALDSQRYFSLLDELDQLVAEPCLGPQGAKRAGSVLPREVRRPYQKAGQWMDQARRAEPGTPRDVALHQARKAAKRARYAGEAVTPAIGRKAARFTKQVKRFQSVLGEHQDAVIARQAERELGIEAHLAGENAFTYGLLYERENHRAEGLRAQARQVWKQASRPRYWNWLS